MTHDVPKAIALLSIAGITACFTPPQELGTPDIGKTDVTERDQGPDDNTNNNNEGDAGEDLGLDANATPSLDHTFAFLDGTSDENIIIDDDVLTILDAESNGVWRSNVVPVEGVASITIDVRADAVYGESLPTESETGFIHNISTDALVTSIRFEDQGPYLDSGPAAMNLGTAEGSPMQVEGIFGNGVFLDAATWLEGDSARLGHGDGEFTWGLWAKKTGGCDRNEVFIGTENPTDTPHLWIGCWDRCASGNFTAVLTTDDVFDYTPPCPSVTINDGEWHHLVITKTNTPDGFAGTYFVDGVRLGQITTNTSQSFDLSGELPFVVGAFPSPGFSANVTVDEIFVFNRALTDQEIERHWARSGSVDLRYRFCETSACENGIFQNADGLTTQVDTIGKYLQVEVDIAGGPPSPRILSVTATSP